MAARMRVTAEAMRNRPAGRLRAGTIASASPPDSRLAAGPPRTKTAARCRRRSRRAADIEAIPLVRAHGPQYQEIRPERSITRGPRRTERNRKPVESPPTTCPASWMQRAATTAARRERTRERTLGPVQGMSSHWKKGTAICRHRNGDRQTATSMAGPMAAPIARPRIIFLRAARLSGGGTGARRSRMGVGLSSATAAVDSIRSIRREDPLSGRQEGVRIEGLLGGEELRPARTEVLAPILGAHRHGVDRIEEAAHGPRLLEEPAVGRHQLRRALRRGRDGRAQQAEEEEGLPRRGPEVGRVETVAEIRVDDDRPLAQVRGIEGRQRAADEARRLAGGNQQVDPGVREGPDPDLLEERDRGPQTVQVVEIRDVLGGLLARQVMKSGEEGRVIRLVTRREIFRRLQRVIPAAAGERVHEPLAGVEAA